MRARVNSYNFNDAYSHVELVQAAASNTGGDLLKEWRTSGNDIGVLLSELADFLVQ